MTSLKVPVARRRVKVGATLDPDLVGALDLYVTAHPGLNRSALLDEALHLWYAREQEAAMEHQLREGSSSAPTARRSMSAQVLHAVVRAIRRAVGETLPEPT